MAKTKTVRIGKQEFLVADEGFKTLIDDWNEYETASGIKVRVRLIVNQLYRLLDKDGKPVFDSQGDPSVLVHSQNIVVATGGPSADDTNQEVH